MHLRLEYILIKFPLTMLLIEFFLMSSIYAFRKWFRKTILTSHPFSSKLRRKLATQHSMSSSLKKCVAVTWAIFLFYHMRTISKLWLIYSIFDERYDCQPGLATCQKCVTDRICGFIKRDLVEKVVGYISLDNPVATLNGVMPKDCGAEIHYSKKHQGFLFEVSLNYKIADDKFKN